MSKERKTSKTFNVVEATRDADIPLNDVGDYEIQKLFNAYACERMLENKSIFDRAYDYLVENEMFSSEEAFGEMHADGYLWVEKHDEVKVIVEERQSYRFIYIDDGKSFHIRALDYEFNYPEARRKELEGVTVDRFREQDFRPNSNSKFEAFQYGDTRDEAYVLSLEYFLEGHEKCDYADGATLFAIRGLEFWKPYLEDPTTLE